MLLNIITNFLQYCKNNDFAERSLESLTLRLNEFNQFAQSHEILSIQKINMLMSLAQLE